MAFIKECKRQVIETAFSQIKALFLSKVHAVTFKGFIIKIILFILAFQIHKAFFS